MADQLEGARTLPVQFLDQGDGSVAERVATTEPADVSFLKDLTSATATGTPGAEGTGELIVAVPRWARMALIRWVSGGSGTVQFEWTPNGGTTWEALLGQRGDAATSSSAISVSQVATYIASMPPGATHIRIRVSTFTTGPISVRIGLSANPASPGVGSVASTLGSGGASIGYTKTQGLWVQESVAALGAAGTLTGGSRDLFGVATATGLSSSSATLSLIKEFRAQAISDVAGTLHVETSTDNVTWRRVESVAATQLAGAGNFVAKISHLPVCRWCRVVYVNGAGAQTFFLLTCAMIGA